MREIWKLKIIKTTEYRNYRAAIPTCKQPLEDKQTLHAYCISHISSYTKTKTASGGTFKSPFQMQLVLSKTIISGEIVTRQITNSYAPQSHFKNAA